MTRYFADTVGLDHTFFYRNPTIPTAARNLFFNQFGMSDQSSAAAVENIPAGGKNKSSRTLNTPSFQSGKKLGIDVWI